METLDSEKEQLASIKKWIQENGLSIVAGVVLGLGGVYGWRYWQEYDISQSEIMSAQLNEAINQIDSQQYEAGAKIAQQLADENSGTLYGDMAQLVISRARVQQGLLDEAAKPLQALLDGKSSFQLSNIVRLQFEGSPAQFQNIARLRLVRIYLAQSKFDAALALIPDSSDKAYVREYEELRGDIAFYKGEKDKARAAYTRALALASLAEDTQFLQMKLDDLPAAGE